MKQVAGNKKIALADVVGTDAIDILPPQLRPWYRQTAAGEKPNHYGYFKQYLAMPLPRNISKLARTLRMEGQNLRNLSARFKWVDRAAAYDDFDTNRELDRRRAENEKAELRWAARRNEQREQEWELAQELLDKVRLMLRVPLFSETVHEHLKDIDPDGRIIVEQVITFAPLEWGAVDMARFFEVASKMARLATGMDTDQKKIRIDVSSMTDEELERLANSK